MAQMVVPHFRVNTGDIRRKLSKLDLAKKELRSVVADAMRQEARVSVADLRNFASRAAGSKPRRRSGALARSAGSVIVETPYTVRAYIGYLNPEDEETWFAGRTLTGIAKSPIEPVNAEKLAFPIPGVSPTDIVTASYSRRLSVAEAKAKYVLIWREDAILGRKRGVRRKHRGERLYFLFARRDFVIVPRYINMQIVHRGFVARLRTRLRDVFSQRVLQGWAK